LGEAEVSKGCNLCRKFGTLSIFTLLVEEVQFIYNNYSGGQRNNGMEGYAKLYVRKITDFVTLGESKGKAVPLHA